ncbi:MAG: hypothetical protein RLZZ60_1253, partial [Bacteroidota bacterium]
MKSLILKSIVVIFSILASFSSLKAQESESISPIRCKTGVFIKTMRIHQTEEQFEVMFYWWLRVDSADITADYSEISAIEFINAESEVEIDLQQYDTANSAYYVVGTCKGLFPYKADYHKFPYDIQSLNIAVENKLLNSDDIVYVPDDLTTPINLFKDHRIEILNGDQFKIAALTAVSDPYTYKTNFGDPSVEPHETYSRIEFTIKINRDPVGIMQKLALPLLVVLILAYLVFYIPDFEIGTASALTVTALLAAIAFQWTLNDALPKVSYLTLVDRIFYMVYIYIFYAMFQTV